MRSDDGTTTFYLELLEADKYPPPGVQMRVWCRVMREQPTRPGVYFLEMDNAEMFATATEGGEVMVALPVKGGAA